MNALLEPALSAPAQQRRTHPIAQLLWRWARLAVRGQVSISPPRSPASAAFFTALRPASCASWLGWRCVGHGKARLGSRPTPFPAPEHAERVGKRPAHCRRDPTRDTLRQRTNVVMLDRKCERPFRPQHRELLPGFLGAAISLYPIWGCHAILTLRGCHYIKPGWLRCQGRAAVSGAAARRCRERSRRRLRPGGLPSLTLS